MEQNTHAFLRFVATPSRIIEKLQNMNKPKSVQLIHPQFKAGIVSLLPTAILADNQISDVSYEVRLESQSQQADSVWARATITNTGASPMRLKGIRWSCDPEEKNGPALHFPNALQPRVFSTENLRADYFGTGTVEGDRYAYPLTNQHVEYGNAEEHLFPGVFVAAAAQPIGLLVAQASQQRFYALFRFRGRMEHRQNWLFEIEERVNGITELELKPDESLHGEKLFFHLAETNDPQQATVAYFRLLRADGAFARRAENPLPTQRIYCTWNYDFMADIDEEKVLGQMPILKSHFPQVKFVQLDDGYQTCHKPGQRAMIDLCYGDLEHPFDTARFPDGPKAFTDRIKAAGLRPAIWLGLWASLGSPMLKDHPDWILRDDTGAPLLFSAWYGGTAILDPSIPGVRDYLDRMCRTVFGEWGFEGVKLDFSSFAFNGKRVRYRHPGKSGVELRHELEGIFRKHLPRDGFFGWCVVAGTAQPFLSQADYFRNAVDIGHGNWDVARRIAMWTANTCLLLQEWPCLPNIDSIGWSKDFDETSWNTWLNFCAISGMALEVSGDLRKLPEHRLRRLSKTLALSDPDRMVQCPGLGEARNQSPAVWFATGREHSLVGVFNWRETPTHVEIASVLPSLSGQSVTDAWSGATATLPTSIDLEPRGSRLWVVGK